MQEWQKSRGHNGDGEPDCRRPAKNHRGGPGHKVFFVEELPQLGVRPPDACSLASLNDGLQLGNHAAKQRRRKNQNQNLYGAYDEDHVNLRTSSRETIIRKMYSK